MDDSATTFDELPLSAPVLRGLADAGFTHPSPIQARAIPLCRFGIDLIAQAKSGTGKTLVFALTALELVQPGQPAPQVLILAPTREIALQSRDVCRVIGSHVHGLSCNAFVGGTSMRNDVALSATSHIACGTPGRVVGLLLSEAIVAERIRLLVLDEADKLCDEGFEAQLRYLLTALPERKQALAFSATYPASLLSTLRASMRAPLTVSLLEQEPPLVLSQQWYAERVTLANDGDEGDPLALLERPVSLGHQEGDHGTPPSEGEEDMVGRAALKNVRQHFQMIYPTTGSGPRLMKSQTASAEKQTEIIRLLDSLEFHQAIVFCNHPEQAARLCRALNASGFPSEFISGAHTQSARNSAMQRMRAFDLRVLVATDLLARGVDFGRVTLVIHHALPRDLPTYLHRVGRTGRFGARGLSIMLLWENEMAAAKTLLTPLAVSVTPLPLNLPVRAYMDDQPPSHESDSVVALGEKGGSGGARLDEMRRMRNDVMSQEQHTPPLPQRHRPRQNTQRHHQVPAAEQGVPRRISPRHASAEAIALARERGRQRGLETAQQRARGLHSYGHRWLLTPEQHQQWWEGLA